MLTRLIIRNFKTFDSVDIALGDRVVFVGPNNAGKTTALQALALWDMGVRRCRERGGGDVSHTRSGVTINRKDLMAMPVPALNLLWRGLRTHECTRPAGQEGAAKNIRIEIEVHGIGPGGAWEAAVEFDYANEESLYCRAKLAASGERTTLPAAATAQPLAYLPPMSGLAANELRLDAGAVAVRIGEGRTAEVLRNLCWQALERRDGGAWARIVRRMDELFGVTLEDPTYLSERGEITMAYRSQNMRLDLAASGRGQQQTLLLLAHMAAHPGSALLLDEPDAHLEILGQRQIYNVLADAAQESGSQIIAASHSEVILNEAAGRDVVVAFIGKPHVVADRGVQAKKALRDIGWEHYLQAEQNGWILYLEGSTDLSILRALAAKLRHPAEACLARPLVHYVGNQSARAREHFYGLRDAVPHLGGAALFDRPQQPLRHDPHLVQLSWRRREAENYIATRASLRAYAAALGRELRGDLFAATAVSRMDDAITKVAEAVQTLHARDVFGPDTKASDDLLDPVFKHFLAAMQLPNETMRKRGYHLLAAYVPPDGVDPEVAEKLDAIADIAQRHGCGEKTVAHSRG